MMVSKTQAISAAGTGLTSSHNCFFSSSSLSYPYSLLEGFSCIFILIFCLEFKLFGIFAAFVLINL